MINDVLPSHPVFVSGQLLTSENLNATREFLKDSLQVSRSSLSGVGVSCGLEVVYDNSNPSVHTITVTRGFGITSDGYLINQPETVTYTHFSPHYVNKNNYIFKQGAVAVQNSIGVLDNNGGCSLTELDPANKVVVAFVEQADEDIEFCVSNDGNLGGAFREFNLRLLILDKVDLDAFFSHRFVQRPDPVLDVSNGPALLKLKRFHTAFPVGDPVINNLNQISEYSQIADLYTSIIEASRVEIGAAIKAVFRTNKSFLSLNFFGSGASNQELEAFIDTNLVVNTDLVTNNLANLQYVYSYLKDLVKAYNEFAAHSYATLKDCYSSLGNPDNIWCPKHLMLGALNMQNVDFTEANGFIFKDTYRNVLVKNAITEGKEIDLLRAQGLFERLIKMIETFSVPATSPLLLTPSLNEEAALGKRALPFYYQQSDDSDLRLMETWDDDLLLRGAGIGNVYSYHVQTVNTDTNPNIAGFANNYPVVAAPFDYEVLDKNFIRIEGLIGKSINTVTNALDNLRSSNNIRFDYSVVSLSVLPALPTDPITEFHDLSFFHHLADSYEGLEHMGGVPVGGTFIIVVDAGNFVVADFSLPMSVLN